MGIFGNRPPYQTPGYGDGTMPGYGQPPMGTPGIDPSLMQIGPDPYAADRPEAAPGFFGKGRKLRDFVGYGLGAIAQQFGGQNPYQQQMDADNEMQREVQRAQLLARLRAETEASTPQIFNTGDGGIAQVLNGNVSMLREPDAPRVSDPILARMQAGGIDPQSPEGRAMIDRSISGYQFTDPGIQAQVRVARGRAQATAANRAPPRGGAGGGVPGATRAKLVSEAEAAIAAGADRAKVYARLAKMGVQ